MSVKPIIDIMIVVEDIKQIDLLFPIKEKG